MTYTVSLDNFSGPLDLLLHLIRQEEVAIQEIPISVICDRYLGFLRNLEKLDVDVASEFLVMAATLMLIKSRSLLPTEEEVDLDEELDPQDELIQQLLEYKQFKLASRDLNQLADQRATVHPFQPPRIERPDEIALEEIDLVDLARAFAALLQETGLVRAPRLIHAEKPLREYIDDVFTIIRARGTLGFNELFQDERERESIIGRFLALLELARRGRIRAVQVGSFDEIAIVLQDDRDISQDEIELMEAEMLDPPDETAAHESWVPESVPDEGRRRPPAETSVDQAASEGSSALAH